MKVKDLLILLQQCDAEAEVVFNAPFDGYKSVNVLVLHEELGGVGNRYSFEKIQAVEFTQGDVSHMEGQGMNVLSFEKRDPCPCNQCLGRA